MTIEKVLKDYESALNASSTEQVMKLYGENPIFMPQNSTALEGREAIEKGYDQIFNRLRFNVKFTLHEIEEFGEWAYVRTTSAGETKTLANDSKSQEANNEIFIFRMENGGWKFHRYLFATSNPPNAEQ
ncbi:MAG: DUF4440 domain-containing protein [Acidobacteriota bacterium]